LARRLQEKLVLKRRLYALGYTPEQVRLVFRFVDWLLRLPEGLRTSFAQEVRTFEEEQQMTLHHQHRGDRHRERPYRGPH
jgi:hypothetical protein